MPKLQSDVPRPVDRLRILKKGLGLQPQVYAPTVGAVRGPDILLTAGFTDQYHSIGWYHLYMGPLSNKWSVVVAMYQKTPHNSSSATAWVSQAISFLWKYT